MARRASSGRYGTPPGPASSPSTTAFSAVADRPAGGRFHPASRRPSRFAQLFRAKCGRCCFSVLQSDRDKVQTSHAICDIPTISGQHDIFACTNVGIFCYFAATPTTWASAHGRRIRRTRQHMAIRPLTLTTAAALSLAFALQTDAGQANVSLATGSAVPPATTAPVTEAATTAAASMVLEAQTPQAAPAPDPE